MKTLWAGEYRRSRQSIYDVHPVLSLALYTRSMVYNLLTIAISLFLAWHVLLACNFFYGFWHDHIGIAENISQYGPENIYRMGFADTSRAQRIDLFSQICHAISNEGKGLADIRYSVTAKGIDMPLLHQAEITHLQDVANLITALQLYEPILFLLWLALLGMTIARSWTLPSYRQLLLVNAIWIGVVGVIIAAVGWVTVFYKLHTLVFPDDHQWFFYYHESLMSTMMKAPDLFLYIGLTLAAFATLIYIALHLSCTGIAKHLPR